MVIRPLAAADFDAVFEAFTDAFSDYVVPLTLTREQLAEMITRRGWVPEASVGLFDDEHLVAFTLNGVEGTRAYDTGTGVVRTHRRRGLGRQMLDFADPLLREHGCTEYVLEVLDNNPGAIALYLGEGFRETRGLQCWRLESQSLKVSESQSSSPVTPLRLCDFETLRLWWDVQPAWQNSTASIHRAQDKHVILGNDDGYAILFPSTGDLAQLAVRREARRRGFGTRLLEEAARIAEKPLRIMNVDERDEGIARFLERAGAQRTVRQLEMVRAL